MNNVITEELMPALEGAIPAILATASVDGIPNATYIWQVFYVDENHVAVSRQFFNKTAQNLSQNPVACILVTSPVTYLLYKLHVRFVGSQQEGPIFERIALQVDIVAGMQNTINTFNLMSADIFEIIQIDRIDLS
jgi:predicted pyridoxine 5'-phosphate oxidase superfamily flavin-nucleotide-binding protein